MAALQFEAPLTWPEGLPQTPRAQQRTDHGFAQMGLGESIGFLDQELQEMQASGTLYLDIEQPAIARLTKKVGSRTGACLKFKHHSRAYILACDRWQATEHNVYALHLTLRSFRSIERWGTGSMPVLLHSFEAGRIAEGQGETDTASQSWMAAFGLGPTATLEDAVAVYHRRAKLAASDPDALLKFNTLMDEARVYFGKKS